MAKRKKKKTNVVLFPGVGESVLNHVAEPNEGLIERLRALLAEAESGNLRHVSYAGVTRERTLLTGWAGNGDSHSQIAAVQRLQFRIMMCDFQDEDQFD